VSILAGYNSSGSPFVNPDGTPIIPQNSWNSPAIVDSTNTSGLNNYGNTNVFANQGNVFANNQNNPGNLSTAMNQNNVQSFNSLDSTLGGGFDSSKLSKEQILTLQKELENAGYNLPNFGADGSWGNETQAAYNQWQKDKSGSPGNNQINNNSMLSMAANNQNSSVDQTATNEINQSNEIINDVAPELNTNTTDSTAAVAGADAAGAGGTAAIAAEAKKLQAKKANVVGDMFSNMSFGSYSSYK